MGSSTFSPPRGRARAVGRGRVRSSWYEHGVEALECRRLLTQVITSPGPITQITVGADTAFQVRRSDQTGGQIFSSNSAPADAGFFVRYADGKVNGFDANASGAARSTNSIPFTSVSQTLSSDGLTITNVMRENAAPAGVQLQVTQTTSYRTGDEFFKINNRLQNLGSSALVIDAFAAADIFLANSDRGVGFRNAATGAVGGTDASGAFNIFFQPDPSTLAPSHFQESGFSSIWSTIGGGGHFNDTILAPSGSPPFDSDPNYIDNGIGLEWRAVSIAPGGTVTIGYFAAFGQVSAILSPFASLGENPAPTPGQTGYNFTVVYADDTAINAATIDDNDLTITGPGGAVGTATRVTSGLQNGSPLSVTYRFAAPGGRFDPSDNGTYTVSINANAVADDGGAFVPTGQLGTFTVSSDPIVGTLDPTFGSSGSGVSTFDPPGPPLNTTDLIPIADGFSIALAHTVAPGSADVTIFRTNDVGALDTTFGGSGTGLATLDIGGDDRAKAIVQQAGGKYLVVGTTSTFNGSGVETDADFFVARFNADGSLDTTFGNAGQGFAVADFGPASFDRANDLVVQADGGIIVFGQSTLNDAAGDFAFARFSEAGVFDTTFGTSGRVLTNLGGADVVNAVTLDAAGRFVAAGSTATGSAGSFAIARYGADGAIDTTFGQNGILLIDFLPGFDEAQSIVLQADGMMIAGGLATTGSPNDAGFDADFAVARIDASGVLDAGFGAGGKNIVDFNGELSSISKLILLPGGKLVAAGLVVASLNTVGVESVRVGVTRLNLDGSLDTSFSGDGRLVLDFNAVGGSSGSSLSGGTATELEDKFELFRQSSQGLVSVTRGGGILLLATRGPEVAFARLIGDGGAPSLFVALVPDISEIEVTAATFTVRFVDDQLVDVSRLGTGDIRVTGPNGFNQLAEFVSVVEGNTNAPERTVRYRIRPATAGGSFVNADEGTYQLAVEPNRIADINGNTLPGGPIPNATFTITIPENLANLRVDGPLTGKFPAAVVGGAKAAGGTVRVTNSGDLDAKTTVDVTVFASTDAAFDEGVDTPIVTINGVKLSLKPGKSRALKLKFTQFPSGLPDGDYFLIARVDSANTVAELKESDNVAPTAAAINIAAPFVDLSGTPGAIKGALAPGKKVTASVLLANRGNTPVRQTSAAAILASLDGAVVGNDTAVGSAALKLNLKASASRNTRLAFTLPTGLAPGSYTLLALLDEPSVIAESNEANNVVVLGTFTV